jgi:hypothetical protein
MSRKISRYGWLPDLPDHCDFLYAASVAMIGAPPASVDICFPQTLPAISGQSASFSEHYTQTIGIL